MFSHSPHLDGTSARRCHLHMHAPLKSTLIFGLSCLSIAALIPHATELPLFSALPFDSWKHVGGAATFTLEPEVNADIVGGTFGPTLRGHGPIDRNGFLASPRVIGDFHLSVDVRIGSIEDPQGTKMNSGIQIRSREQDATIMGLQIEIDPSARAWSGGVYEERGRAWLAPLRENEAARKAFKLGAWNHYDIECIGPRIRTKINGVPCAEWYDATVSGLLAFQVHGGGACEVAFRTPLLDEFGTHAWSAIEDAAGASSGERCAWSHAVDANMRGLRMELSGSGHVLVLAQDGTRLLDVPIAPIAITKDAQGEQRAATAAEASKPRTLELLWLDSQGAVILNGALERKLTWSTQPAWIRVLGDCDAVKVEALTETQPASPANKGASETGL